MKTNKYFLVPIIFLLTSCYIYKPYVEKEVDETTVVNNNMTQQKSIRNSKEDAGEKVKLEQGKKELSPEERETQSRKEKEREEQKSQNQNADKPSEKSNSGFSRSDGTSDDKTKRNTKESEKKADEPKSKETGIKAKLLPNKYFKISALGNQYKIQVDKWEGDTLVAHKIRKPSKQYKFHMNDIEEEAILERRFSKPFSDLLTVGAYASGAAIVLLLVL